MQKLWHKYKGNTKVYDDDYEDLVRVGRFIVHIGISSKTDMKKVRKYFPREEYKCLKNRKSARMQRQITKDKT